MSTYTGPATLLLADGARESGTANLRTDDARNGRLRSWDGNFSPDNPTIDLFNSIGGNLPLELPNGQTGEVLLQSLNGTASGVIIRLPGSGPQPF